MSAATINATLEAVDLSRAVEHEHPDIHEDDTYLALVDGEFQVGTFSRQWYGLNFDCGWGMSGIQFDAPGWNKSGWEALWRIVKC